MGWGWEGRGHVGFLKIMQELGNTSSSKNEKRVKLGPSPMPPRFRPCSCYAGSLWCRLCCPGVSAAGLGSRWPVVMRTGCPQSSRPSVIKAHEKPPGAYPAPSIPALSIPCTQLDLPKFDALTPGCAALTSIIQVECYATSIQSP